MSLELVITTAFTYYMWSIWIRRKTIRIPHDRALTVALTCQTGALILTVPTLEIPCTIGHPLYILTGIHHVKDYIGHMLLLTSLCFIIYAVACRITPNHQLRSVLRRVEIPGITTSIIMLTALIASPNLKHTHTQPDFFTVPTDTWLKIYWAVFATHIIYLCLILKGFLLILRKDPRSRTTANLFIAAAFICSTVAALMALRALEPQLVNPFWIWTGTAAGGIVSAFASARSWQQRQRHIDPGHETLTLQPETS